MGIMGIFPIPPKYATLIKHNSGSYNGRRVVSETNNEGPIPSPEALTI
jgi:hypothetical protein